MQGSLQFAGNLISMRQKEDEELTVVNMFDISSSSEKKQLMYENYFIKRKALRFFSG